MSPKPAPRPRLDNFLPSHLDAPGPGPTATPAGASAAMRLTTLESRVRRPAAVHPVATPPTTEEAPALPAPQAAPAASLAAPIVPAPPGTAPFLERGIALIEPLRPPHAHALPALPAPETAPPVAAAPDPETARNAPARPGGPEPDADTDRLDTAADTMSPGPLPASAQPVMVRLFVPNTVADATVTDITETLRGAGYETSDPARVGFDISRTNVRYYHRADAEGAAALAGHVDGVARDFTGAGTRPQAGWVELWVAGDGEGVARATVRTGSRPTPEQVAANLKREVIEKLREARAQ